MNYPIASINRAGLSASVYATLRDALITGRLKPNDRLRIRELAAQLGTSVTPVRDAILQLAKEQALELRTPRDIRVPELTLAQYLEIRTLRIAIEGIGAENAARLVTPTRLSQIEENIALNIKAINKADFVDALRLNSEFHLLLAQTAQMPLLCSFLDRLWMRTGPLIAQSYAQFSQHMAIGHHQEVLAALRNSDPEAARLAIQDDIQDGHEKLFNSVDSKGNDQLAPTVDK
ncbi:GntR family transcriptional regulator [Prodigiosinella aquatilis]|nr:GntR family transcriptional regulator [Prodigiosinella sp. LS101]WJV52327.1 GntR family transcriptional regulator [Prodigiosinella sp. LS101]WJV56681.1 GntR family transcriptional regulator [Pectobacteriaceae bacterium C111]